jgi:hypothetical protein
VLAGGQLVNQSIMGLRSNGQCAEEDPDTDQEEQQGQPPAEGAAGKADRGAVHRQPDEAERSPALPDDQHAAPPRNRSAMRDAVGAARRTECT